MSNNLSTLLAASPLFANLSANELETMINCLQVKVLTYKKHSYITVEGEPFTGLGVLLIGEAAVIKENAAGNRNVMTVLRAGDIFGEMIAFSRKNAWPASVVAQTDCSVIFLPSDKIAGKCPKACESHAQLIKNLLAILSEKALLLHRKVQYLTINSLRGKISTYLYEQHKATGKNVFNLALNRNDLADFLSVSRTALSREMGRMRDEGIIEFYRASVKINNIEGLKKLGGV